MRIEPATAPDIEHAAAPNLELRTLYRILRLRQEVFVVEQQCAFVDLDGRDLEPGARHLWIDDEPDAPSVTACLRLLAEPAGATQVGRIVTAASARRRGLGTALLRRALELGTGPWVMKAQSRLAGWYATFGFVPDGPEFLEDDIPHTPLRRS
jgi:ElaA protein